VGPAGSHSLQIPIPPPSFSLCPQVQQTSNQGYQPCASESGGSKQSTEGEGRNKGTEYSICWEGTECPVKYPVGGRRLSDLCSDLSKQPGSKPHVAVRQLQSLSNLPAPSLELLFSAVIPRQWDSFLTTEGRTTDHYAFHSLSSLLL
jgi:hypothetical protein